LSGAFMLKVCPQFSRPELFSRNCLNAKLEKIKNLLRSKRNISAVFDKVCVSFFDSDFRQSLVSVFSKLKKQKGEKLVSKINDKAEQI